MEGNALRFRLNHHILPRQIYSDEVNADVERLLNLSKIRNDDSSEIDDETRDEIKYIVKSFWNDAKRICSSFPNQALHRTLKSLSQEKNIKTCKFDKGKGTTIMDSNKYYEKLESILNEKRKFAEVKENKKTHSIIAEERSIAFYSRTYFNPICTGGGANLPSLLSYFNVAPKRKKVLLCCTLTWNQI